MRISKPQATQAVRRLSRDCSHNVQDFSTESGTLMTRIELSALADTNSRDVGLNLMVVGGNSCAFRIVTRGYIPPSEFATIQNKVHRQQGFPRR